MSQTKIKSQCALSEFDVTLPGWNQKQRHDLFEGIRIHGMKRLKKLQRHIGSKTHEEVRIATEVYKKEVRNRQLLFDMERQIQEAVVADEDHTSWLEAQLRRTGRWPIPALEALLHQALLPIFQQTTELRFPNWRRAEMNDFLATVELSNIINNKAQHIPTKSKIEITGASDAYAIMCDVRTNAIKRGLPIPTYDDLRPGYIYLQCVVYAMSDNNKLKNLKIPRNVDPDMAKAKFVLQEWLMPDVGPLTNGWTKDEKYLLIVAIETYGPYDILKIQSIFGWKTRSELKLAIIAIKKEAERKENNYKKTIAQRYRSLASWGNTLIKCTKAKQHIAAAKRLIFALEELPEPPNGPSFVNLVRPEVTMEDITAAVLNIGMEGVFISGKRLIPLLKRFIKQVEREPDSESEAETETTTESDTDSETDSDEPQCNLHSKAPRNAQPNPLRSAQPKPRSMPQANLPTKHKPKSKPKSKSKNKGKPKHK